MFFIKHQNAGIFLLLVVLILLTTQVVYTQGTSFSNTPNTPVNNTSLATDTIVVSSSEVITQVSVSVNIEHTHGGDLAITLRHQNSGRSVALLRSPNGPGFAFGCGADGIFATFDDRAAIKMDDFDCSGDFEKPIRGVYQPTALLSTFVGINASGTWTIEVRDANISDSGFLRSWTLTINDLTPPIASSGIRFDDDRINNREVDRAAPVAIYCRDDGGITIYDITEGHGTISVVIAQTAIRDSSKPPATSVLLGERDGNRVYQLSNGQLQVNARGLQGEEEKEYVFTWNVSRCPKLDISEATTTSPPPQPVSGFFIVNRGNLQVRSGDGFEYSVVGVVKGGERLLPLGRSKDREWWYVQFGDLHGWVEKTFLIIRGDVTDVPVIEANGQIQLPRFILFMDRNIYNSPTPKSLSLCTIPSNTEYFLVGRTRSADWYQIEVDCNGTRIVGWVEAAWGSVRDDANRPIPVTG